MMEEREPRTTTEQPADEGLEVRQDGRAEPRKPHGDALIDGSGTRHGVGRRDERPEVSDPTTPPPVPPAPGTDSLDAPEDSAAVVIP